MAKKKARRATKKKATRKAGARGAAGRKKGSKKKARRKAGGGSDLIISKSRTKALATCNVSGEFYGALDEKVREMIAQAEERADANNRRTLRPQDL